MANALNTTKATNQVTDKRQHVFEGVVVGTNEAKTIRVSVESVKIHPKYRKQYSVSKKYAVHDETGVAKVGNKVSFVECRPLSKTKRWRLVSILK